MTGLGRPTGEPAAPGRPAWRRVAVTLGRGVLPLAGALAVWEGVVRAWRLPAYLLPGPSRIAGEMVSRGGLLAQHAVTTAGEVLAGFLVGATAGFALALAMDAWPALRRALVPWLVASQAVPVFAVAPLLVLWFGYGMASKVVMAAVITFFPVTINVLDGLRPDPDALRLFTALGASRWQVLVHLQLPGALPALFSGLKVAASVSTIAAVVGEWVGARAGLGYLMQQANAQLRVPLVFGALAWLTAMGLALYGAVAAAERRWSWRR